MKRCPTCNKTFTDQNLSFCIDDGTPLVSADEPVDESPDEATLVFPSSGDAESRSSGPSSPSGGHSVPPYQPPGSYVPPGAPRDFPPGQRRRRAWPWVVATLAIALIIVGGMAIAATIFIPKMIRASSNRNASNYNANIERSDNYNSNLNGSNPNAQSENVNGNDNSDAQDTTPAPTDEEEVLSDLTDLEHEWTVANINADKKKLNHILADDYVGTSEGKPQGKAEYLKTIERDTSIQKWDFEDLKVSLKGDRASLTGNIRLVVGDQNVAYRFTDKFVWRDNRWQATSSEVTPIQ